MSLKSPFDDIAREYDALFTNSANGKAQRKIVWEYLKKNISPGMEVLEINCGTGEDAFFLTSLGCTVLAMDVSEGMIAQCINKFRNKGPQDFPDFRHASFGELKSLTGERKFDLVFSDFSGLNCIGPDELKTTCRQLHSALNPSGRIILVVFGTNCIWEKIYMLFKRRIRDISRRSGKMPVTAILSGIEIPIWYYSRKDLQKMLRGYFDIVNIKAVGLFIPPAYLDFFFRNKHILLRLLSAAERIFGRFSFLSNYADHYLIEFVKV